MASTFEKTLRKKKGEDQQKGSDRLNQEIRSRAPGLLSRWRSSPGRQLTVM
jgi:hypothetical protein